MIKYNDLLMTNAKSQVVLDHGVIRMQPVTAELFGGAQRAVVHRLPKLVRRPLGNDGNRERLAVPALAGAAGNGDRRGQPDQRRAEGTLAARVRPTQHQHGDGNRREGEEREGHGRVDRSQHEQGPSASGELPQAAAQRPDFQVDLFADFNGLPGGGVVTVTLTGKQLRDRLNGEL